MGATHVEADKAQAASVEEQRKPVTAQDIPSLQQYLHTSSLLAELDAIYGDKDKLDRYNAIQKELEARRKNIIDTLTAMMHAAIEKQGPSGGDIRASTIVRRCSRETWLGLELTLIDALHS